MNSKSIVKQAEILIVDNNKTSKFKVFLCLCPWTPFCQLVVSPTPPPPYLEGSSALPARFNTHAQARNQELFRAGKVSWNQDTSINILSLRYRRENLKGELFEFLFLDAFETAFSMRYLNHRWTQSGYFFLKQGHFFSIFSKGQARPRPPHPSLPIYAPDVHSEEDS